MSKSGENRVVQNQCLTYWNEKTLASILDQAYPSVTCAPRVTCAMSGGLGSALTDTFPFRVLCLFLGLPSVYIK